MYEGLMLIMTKMKCGVDAIRRQGVFGKTHELLYLVHRVADVEVQLEQRLRVAAQVL
jgi:hypothetical protein